MTASTEQERAEFEAAYVAEKLRILDSEGSADGEKAIRAVMLRRNARGDYDNSLEAHFAWWAWQASRRAQVVPQGWREALTELVAAMRKYEMDVDGIAPERHRAMMRRAELLLAAAPQPPTCNPSMHPAPSAATTELVLEPQEGGKPKIVFRPVTAPSCP